jgi:hypothetical protein
VHVRESPIVVVQASNQQGKEVRPEDKVAADSQNGDIITLPIPHFFFNNDGGRAEHWELG